MSGPQVGFSIDQNTVDSTGAYLVGELERLDQTMHGPLVTFTYSRDVPLREDVTIADEQSSFTNSSFASPGGIVPGGKAWISKDNNAMPGVALDIGKTIHPLYLWGMELKWTLPELASAMKLGRPVDTQMYEAMILKHNMDIDEMVYIGDTTYNVSGLVNNSVVTPTNAVNGALGSPLWSQKTPVEILADINTALTNVWAATGFALVPSKILIPPLAYSYLVSTLISSAGNQSIMSFLKQNSLSSQRGGQPLDIQPLKWLTGRGAGGTNRMVVYVQEKNRVRYPLVPMQRTPLEYRSIYQMTSYYCRLGVLEIPYQSTIAYIDGF